MRFLVLLTLVVGSLIGVFVFGHDSVVRLNAGSGLGLTESQLSYAFGAIVAFGIAFLVSQLPRREVADEDEDETVPVDDPPIEDDEEVEDPESIDGLPPEQAIKLFRTRLMMAARKRTSIADAIKSEFVLMQRAIDIAAYDTALRNLADVEEELWSYLETSKHYSLFHYIEGLRDSLQKAHDEQEPEDEHEEEEHAEPKVPARELLTAEFSKLMSALADAVKEEEEQNNDPDGIRSAIMDYVGQIQKAFLDREYDEAHGSLTELEAALMKWAVSCTQHDVHEAIASLRKELDLAMDAEEDEDAEEGPGITPTPEAARVEPSNQNEMPESLPDVPGEERKDTALSAQLGP